MRRKELKSKKGITLIALVVTIVVLLILAAITINLVFSENGIIKKAQNAAEAQKQAEESDRQALESLDTEIDKVLGIVKIPEGLEVGSEVTYNPSGTYNWMHKYCSSTKAEKAEDGTDAYDLLESGTGKDFNIPSWKVLSLDKETGKVELVPSSLATGKVYLGEAQGYNNGVKLLNDACSNLYGNSKKGITARSINIKDIEDYMTETAVAEAHSYVNTSSNTTYGNQVSSAYTSNKIYPVIYAQEKLSTINGEKAKTTGLDLSEQNTFIERSEGTSTTEKIGAITTATSIQPYQTYWGKNGTYMQTAFKPYDEENVDKGNYYNLIMPSGTNTAYWVASRCVDANSGGCIFIVLGVYFGNVSGGYVYNTNDSASSSSLTLLPVVTLSSNIISGDATSGYSVK